MAPVVVIGGGVAGLGSAARLAKLGHSVTLCERTAELGGRFRAADGPTTLTLPAAPRDLFRKSGRPLERELELHPVETPRRHVFDDGTVLDLPVAGRAAQREALADAFGARTAEAVTDAIDGCVPLWELLRRTVLEHRYRGPRALGAAGLRRLTPGRSLQGVLRRLPDLRAADALAATALGPGADPARAPAYQLAQAYVERSFGRFACQGGLAPLLDALARRLDERRGEVELDAEVVEIEVSEGAATGVRLAGGESRPAIAVVCTVPAAPLLAAPPPELRRAGRRDPGSPFAGLDVHDPLGNEPFEVVRHGHVDHQPPGEAFRGGPERLLNRPGHRSPAPTRTRVTGLFCAGPDAQPGPGLPYELLGAALVAGEFDAPVRGRSADTRRRPQHDAP